MEKKLIAWTLYVIALENFALALIPLYFVVIKVIHGSVDISLLLTVVLWIILLLSGLFFLERTRKAFKDKEEAKKEQ